MLALQSLSTSSTPSTRCTPNILPCRIHHTGPVNASKRYWNPETEEGQQGRRSKKAYFRGRKLTGRDVAVPEGYRGVIVQSSDRDILGSRPSRTADFMEDDEDEDEAGDDQIPHKALDQVGTFDTLVVWDHEVLPDNDDVYVRGIEEWIGFAETMHRTDETDGANSGISNGGKQANGDTDSAQNG